MPVMIFANWPLPKIVGGKAKTAHVGKVVGDWPGPPSGSPCISLADGDLRRNDLYFPRDSAETSHQLPYMSRATSVM
jgi:hypothetical protein